MKIIKKTPISFEDVKSLLKGIDKENYEANSTLEYVDKFSVHKKKEVSELRKKIKEIVELPEELIIKLINLCPKNPSTVKTIIFSKKLLIKDAEAKKIAELFK